MSYQKMERKERSRSLQTSPSFVLGSICKLISIFLFSSLVSAGTILSDTLQPSYQEGVKEVKAETFTKQYLFPVSILNHSLQSSSAFIIPTTDNNISTYQNPSLGIGLHYPSNWKVEERTNINNNTIDFNASSIKFTSPSKRDLLVVSAYAQNLSSFPVEQQQNMTLNTLTRTGINTAKANLNNFQLVDLETANVTLGLKQNNEAHKIIYSNTNTNTTFPLQFVTMQTYTIKDGKIYGLSYVSEASQFFRHLPAVQRMIDSFQIID
jgi:hypothetical protein